jgi:endonuclease/exonuclease/phosphatase family metal-dependent hydrolase
VRDPSGTDWPIFAVHLHPNASEADEDARLREIQTLLELTADHRQANRPHVVAGGFNATSPIQQIDPALCLPKTRDQWQANGLSLPRRAIGALLAAGYVDTLHASIGEAAATAGTFSTQFPGQRVDYIMTWGVPRARIRRAWIEQDRLARFASDHYPVGAEVE